MINPLLLIPLAGIGLLLWGLIRHRGIALWVGAGLLSLWAVLGLIDWLAAR